MNANAPDVVVFFSQPLKGMKESKQNQVQPDALVQSMEGVSDFCLCVWVHSVSRIMSCPEVPVAERCV